MSADIQIDPIIATQFSDDLQPDEQILWTGQPGSGTSIPVLPILTTIGSLIFALFWLRGFLPMFKGFGKSPGIFGYFPVLFVAAFLFIFLMPFIRMVRKLLGPALGGKSKTYYAVTNKRALALRSDRGHTLQSTEIVGSPRIDKWINNKGMGYVVVGDMQGPAMSLALVSAMGVNQFDLGDKKLDKNFVLFMDIPNAQAVYDLIRAQVPAETLERMDSGDALEIAPPQSEGTVSDAPPFVYAPSPPRNVPWYVVISSLFGNCLTQFGWVFFGFGLIFVWLFSMQTDLSRPVFWGGVDLLPGKIIKMEGTNISENHSAVYRLVYAYMDRSGVERKGVSYSSWQRYNPGDPCRVEIAKLNHSLSRIEGTGSAPFGWFGLFPIIFPLIGLLIILSTFRSGIKSIRLLKNGQFAYGKYTHAKRASDLVKERAKNAPKITEENERQVYRLYFTFTTTDGRVCETYTDSAYPKELHDEKFELLAYDTNTPENAVLLDSLPGKLRLDNDGSFVLKQGSPFGSLLMLVIPLITVLGHGWFVYHRFFK